MLLGTIFINDTIFVVFVDFKDPEYRREHLKELLKRAEVERKTVVDTIEKSGGGTKVSLILVK